MIYKIVRQPSNLLFTKKPLTLALATIDNDEFLLGGGPGEDDFGVVEEDLVQVRFGKVAQLTTVDHRSLGLAFVDLQ